jgi:hypothetical protein
MEEAVGSKIYRGWPLVVIGATDETDLRWRYESFPLRAEESGALVCGQGGWINFPLAGEMDMEKPRHRFRDWPVPF